MEISTGVLVKKDAVVPLSPGEQVVVPVRRFTVKTASLATVASLV